MDRADPLPLLELIGCAWKSQAVSAAAELRIADALAEAPRTADELARITRCHAPSLFRLMRALVALGLCTEREDARFSITAAGSLLRKDAPDGFHSWALWSGKYLWPLWGRLGDSVRTGKNARKLLYGTDDFDHLEGDREAAKVFNQAMAELTRLVADEVARVYDFAGMRNVVDVGGGYGALLAAVLKACPAARGVLYDLPHAIERAWAHLSDAGLGTRCQCTAGDFFESVPPGADAYLLKSIVHDWNDERSQAILRSCRRAMPSGGRLLLIERILPTRFEASPRHLLFVRTDLNMLIGPGGRERTEAEFRTLLESAGFELTRIVPTSLEFNVIEGAPR